MKIEYIKGNILDTDCMLIAHGCNAQGVMGSGVAKVIRGKWPRVYYVYRSRFETIGLKMGEIIPVYLNSKKWVINCITQKFYGRDPDITYVDYEAVKMCMIDINKKFAKEKGYTSIAMPKIGAGLGGGDWNRISEIIETQLTDIQPIVYGLI